MTIKELLEMKLHEEHKFDHSVPRCFRIVIRVPGGWIYETESWEDVTTSCFVPEPSLQTNMLTNNGYDEWLKTVESDPPEPDYDKTFEAEKDFLTMGRWNWED